MPRDRVTRSVQPNAGVQAWYQAQLETIVELMASNGRDVLREHYTDPGIGFAQDGPTDDVRGLRRALTKWGDRWQARIDAMAQGLAARFVDRSMAATQNAVRAAFKAAGFTVSFKPTAASVAAYEASIAENVSLIKSIPAQFSKDVQTQVWQSVMRGGDLATLSREVQVKYGVAYRRAALIARDQNAKAKALIENVRRQELGITAAYWQHSKAGKEPRPTHVEMDGKRYELAKGMWDEDEKAFIWPGQLINCRCTSRAIIPGFE